MTTSGWTGEPPDGGPALPVTEMLLAQRERGPGDTLELALARSRAAEAREAQDQLAGARDPDEDASAMVNRGYTPGLVTDRLLRCRELETELESERAAIERGEKVTERVRRDLAAGRIGGLEAHERMSGDFGDVERAAKLERQLARAREQVNEAQAMIAPPQQRDADPYEAANRTARTAHQEFIEVTRQRMAEVQAGIRRSEPRPFDSGVAARSETGHVNGSAVAVAERMGLGDDVQRDAHGERIQCVWSPLPGGGYEHVPHGGKCLASGGNTHQRYGS